MYIYTCLNTYIFLLKLVAWTHVSEDDVNVTLGLIGSDVCEEKVIGHTLFRFKLQFVSSLLSVQIMDASRF